MCGADRTYIILSLSRVRMMIYIIIYTTCAAVLYAWAVDLQPAAAAVRKLRWSGCGERATGYDCDRSRKRLLNRCIRRAQFAIDDLCVSADGSRLMSDYSRRVASYNGSGTIHCANDGRARELRGYRGSRPTTGREKCQNT